MPSFILILIFIPRANVLWVWDVQTGVCIKELGIGMCGKIVFFGDQMITIQDHGLSTYNLLSDTEQDEDHERLLGNEQLGAHWVYKGSHWLATKLGAGEKPIINIREFQPTSDPMYPVVESFQVPSYDGEFSFSPVTFHAAFATTTEVAILNIRDLKVQLHNKVAKSLYMPPGCFSSNGHFFACGTSKHEICVWKNTPTCYIFWGTLQTRLLFEGFSFSPAITSILTWGEKGVQLLHLGNSTISQPSNRNEHPYQYRSHLVACSMDGTHVVTAQKGGNVITVINPLLGTPLKSIKVDIQTLDIRIANNTVIAVNGHKLLRWSLRAGEIMQGSCETGREAIPETLGIDLYPHTIEQLILSNDCSQIGYIIKGKQKVFLYDIKSQKLRKCVAENIIGIQFSPDGHQLWAIIRWRPTSVKFLQFGVVGDHLTNVTEQGFSWVSPHQSLCGYCIVDKSKWVEGPGGRKLLWLPPSWRENSLWRVRWEGSFLALLSGHHPKPIIIKFQL